MVTISIRANTVRQSADRRLDDTAFGAGTFSWQDPVHSWVSRADYAPNFTTCPIKSSNLPTALNTHALFLLHALENLKSKRTDSCYQTVNSQGLYHAKILLLILRCLKKDHGPKSSY